MPPLRKKQHDFGHYVAVFCGGGGANAKSGKGAGPRNHGGDHQRHQKVFVYHAWSKKGCDVYFSSRWDSVYQIFDHYHTQQPIKTWWLTAPWDWVNIQELGFDLRTKEFDWSNSKNPTWQQIAQVRTRQRKALRRVSNL